MISVVWVDADGYRFEERYQKKAAFKRAYKMFAKSGKATFVHGTDYDAQAVVNQTNIWGYLRE